MAATTTYAAEEGLPRAPLPSLQDSCDRLLQWSAPLLDAEQLAETQAAVVAFLRPGSPAHRLQAALQREQDEGAGWLEGFWASRYLGRRDRIAVNANYFFLLADSPLGQVERAAALTRAAVDHKQRLDAEAVAPVRERDQVQSMEQNKYLFSATRIPGTEHDTDRTAYSATEPGASRHRHVLVLSRGHAFRLEVLDHHDRPYPVERLAAGLQRVLAQSQDWAPPSRALGHLTTQDRAQWATDRAELLAGAPENAAFLDQVETALFCLCLDDVAPADTRAACWQLLAGSGANRWYDKSFSLIVAADGTAGLNGEHTHLDGTTVVGLIDALLAPGATETTPAAEGEPGVAALDVRLTAALAERVVAAAESFADFTAGCATELVSFDHLGSAQLKSLGVSPDAFVQMAFQLAHQRARGLVGSTYESVATRQFWHGRTEAMRVVTPEVLTFVAAMDDPAVDPAGRVAALRAALAAHTARARECKQGLAPEQHLWELQLTQQRRGAELGATEPLALYHSPGWVVLRQDYLSTSSAPSQFTQYFGFGSTSDRCIGVGYVLLPERFHLHLSTPRAVDQQMQAFAAQLRSVVPELQSLLAGG
ncbi:choline/carnitine O-acyltransferase [Rhodococcus sp. X156]|uniref:choline/carnitine O-acyltransferase n=1 Tax=Rhodococcus sp. X156 TaxID=2499145 RepID=UPI000FD9F90C|nr:choline/carnitine O-acyltransferase [Rhodococcus sp. X156]